MKSSVKNKKNFGLVNRFKNTKLGKWLVKVKLFFIRIVAHSKDDDDDFSNEKFPEESFIYGIKMIYRDWDVAKDCLFFGLELKYAIPLLVLYFLVVIVGCVQSVYYCFYR